MQVITVVLLGRQSGLWHQARGLPVRHHVHSTIATRPQLVLLLLHFGGPCEAPEGPLSLAVAATTPGVEIQHDSLPSQELATTKSATSAVVAFGVSRSRIRILCLSRRSEWPLWTTGEKASNFMG